MAETTEKAEPDTLLPCPLCQAEAQTLLRGFYYRHDPDLEEPSKRSAVLCPTCNCRAPLASWNTRAAPPRCDAQSEAWPVTISDAELAGWARNWHWNNCAEDRPVDPSIYFRDMRMLKAFIEKCRALSETKPAQETDHQKRPFAFAVRRAPENGPDEWRLFRNEGDAREAAEQLDGDYEGLYRVGDRRPAIRAISERREVRLRYGRTTQ